jgi:hypothetical protein
LCSVLPVLLLETNHQIEDLPPPGPGGELRRLRREIYYSYFRYIRNATRRQPIIGKCSSLTSVILVFARTSSTPSLPRTPWGLRFVFIISPAALMHTVVVCALEYRVGLGVQARVGVFHSTVAVEGERFGVQEQTRRDGACRRRDRQSPPRRDGARRSASRDSASRDGALRPAPAAAEVCSFGALGGAPPAVVAACFVRTCPAGNGSTLP